MFTFGQAAILLMAGVYGDVQLLGMLRVGLILGQLFFAGFMVLLLDETLQKGHGLGSGMSMFIGTNICGNILW